MKRTEIERIMRSLAMSQGLYGRILDNIYSLSEEEQESVWSELESQNFNDAVDLVMYIEG